MWGIGKQQQPEATTETSEKQQDIDMTHSVFGDGYSVKSRNSYSTNRFGDEPEVDYDEGATVLYQFIEDKSWDAALHRLDKHPDEARTWVSRREPGTNKTRWRLLPLHAVCIFRAPLALMEALINVYPEGPQMKDDQGMLPIHLACRNGASKGVVMTLIKAFPESLFIRDRKRRSLQDLVDASSSNHKDAVMNALKKHEQELNNENRSHTTPDNHHRTAISANDSIRSQTTNEVDYEHRTQLFRYILKKDWKNAGKRAISHPEEAATWIVTKGFNGNLRFLPIHKACVLQPPEGVVNSILDAYPNGAQETDQDGWLPIHCACFYSASDSIVNALLNRYPKGAHAKDDDGRLALHYACLKGASIGVVEVLLANYAKSAACKDDEGRLPIHHACSKGAPESIVDALLKASPKGAQSKDDQGRLPLHHACRKRASERVIRTLLKVYPRGAQIKDDQDKLAIHYACQHSASSNVVTHLLTTYPESILAKNGFGQTPLDEAKNADNPSDSVVKLLSRFQKEHEKTLADSNNPEEKVLALEHKIASLEKTLGKVQYFGKEIKRGLRKNKDPEDILDKFAEDLICLGSSGHSSSSITPSSSKDKVTPLKNRVFGRSRSTSKGATKS